MSNIERDLRNLLSQRADAAATSPGDWQDLTVRMARRSKRSKRLMASGLVAALLVGPVAGFAVARAVQDTDPAGRVTAAGPSDSDGDGLLGTTAARSAVAGWSTYPGGQNLEQLFRRTSRDGVVIRGYISKYGGNSCQGDGWCPPTDCFPDGGVTGQLSTDAAVGYAMGSHFGGEAPDLRVTGAGIFGANGEGAPARWIVAQAGGEVETVRVSFEDGGRDEMAPVDGVVVLAALADTNKMGGTIEAVDGSGNVVDTVDAATVPSESGFVISTGSVTLESSASGNAAAASPPATVFSSEPQDIDPRCVAPPPALPEPGEQPGNAAEAKAAVERAFALAYDGGLGSDEEKRAVVQDSDALQGVMEEIRSGTFAQQVKDATAVVTEVVFTSPTEAAVRYDINIANYTNFSGRIGKALLIDGVWKVARVTVCADISLAGGNCPR